MNEEVKDMKKLYKSRNNRMLAGVCGGLGEYLGVDPTLVRLLYIFSGIGFFVYIIMALVIPEAPYGYDPNYVHQEDPVVGAKEEDDDDYQF